MIADTAAPAKRRTDWHAWVFRTAALLVTLMLLALGGLHGIVAPWLGRVWVASEEGIRAPETHLWHDGQFGAIVLLLAGCLALALARPRERALALRGYVLTALVFVVSLAPFAPGAAAVFGVALALPAAAYPALARLVRGGAGRPDRGLLGLSMLAGALMAPGAWGWIQLQTLMADEHAHANHWVSGAALCAALVAVGVLAASRRAGWRPLTGLVGLAYVYLGAAAITLPDSAGSWGYAGGAGALIAGLVYLAAAWRLPDPDSAAGGRRRQAGRS